MKYYIIAGEASGDLHGSNLISKLKEKDAGAEIRAWGGDKMKEAGAQLVKHYRELAFMGFVEVLMNLFTILRNIRFCKEDILGFKPDVLVLVDYPGFNMRIAKWAKREGIKVVYYISPQVWAWKKSRVHKLRRDTDRMLVILPFEKDFYAQYQMEVDFVGHPLIDEIRNLAEEEKVLPKDIPTDKKIIALLPGSRKQEITSMLKVMLKMVPKFPEYQFVVAGAPSQEPEFYQSLMKGSDVPVVFNETYALLSNAYAGLITSGTATLETALFKVPEVVCYKGNAISYWIARWLVDIKFISLVNLIADRELVRELIQSDLNEKNLEKELRKILVPENHQNMKSELDELEQALGGEGASLRTAEIVTEMASS